MYYPLSVLSDFGSPVSAEDAADAYARFVQRRDALTAQMEMASCDGCDGCGLRCMDGFTVSETEYDAVRAFLAAQPAEARVWRVREQNKTFPWPGAEDLGVTVTFCPFRDTERGSCAIYPVRPTVCRLFGHTPWLPCPIGAIDKVPAGSAEVWNAYQKFERRTWAEWDREKGAPVPPDGTAEGANVALR